MSRLTLDYKSKSEKDYEVTKGYIELANRYEWQFMVTFTSSEYLTMKRASLKMERLSNDLSKKQPEVFRIFWVAEPHESGSYHIHALITVKDAKASIIKRTWNRFSGTYERSNINGTNVRSNNRCEIKPYDKGRGGNIYTLKNIMRDNVEHGFVL
jgi:hypothetical protein